MLIGWPDQPEAPPRALTLPCIVCQQARHEVSDISMYEYSGTFAVARE